MQIIKKAWNGMKAVCNKVVEKGQALVTATVAGVGTMLGLSKPAEAAPPDLTSLTTAVDFSTVTTAVLAVAAALIVVYIAWKGAKMVISAVRGG